MKTTQAHSAYIAGAMPPSRQSLVRPMTLIAVCICLLGGCTKKTESIDVDSLPELPSQISDTLDPQTMATKAPPTSNVAVKDPALRVLPCCSSTKTRKMQVIYSYTKCVPLRIAVTGPFPQLVRANPGGSPTPTGGATPSPGQPSVQTFKLTSFKSKVLSEKLFCTTSQGPWEATFTEERACSPPTPQDTLIIKALGDQVEIHWAGGTPNHPPGVQVVSCRDIGETQMACGISNCQCVNSSCPETQPCTCTLQDWFP